MLGFALAVVLLGTGCLTRPELQRSGDDAGGNNDANIAFVSSMPRAPSSFGGVVAVDAWCQDLADSAHLAGTYISWTSSSTNEAIILAE